MSAVGSTDTGRQYEVSRYLAYVFFGFAAVVVATTCVLHIQAREDLRSTVLAHRQNAVNGIVTGHGVNGQEFLTAQEDNESLHIRQSSLEVLHIQVEAIDDCDQRVRRLIEHGAGDSLTLLSSIWEELEQATKADKAGAADKQDAVNTGTDRTEALPVWLQPRYVLVASLAFLFTIFLSRFMSPIPSWSVLNVLAYVGSRFLLCFSFAIAVASIWSGVTLLKFLSSNALLAIGMMAGGVLGILSDFAKEIMSEQAGNGTGQQPPTSAELEQKRLQRAGELKKTVNTISGDSFNGELSLILAKTVAEEHLSQSNREKSSQTATFLKMNHGGLLSVTIGVLVGGIAFVLIKSGKQVFLSQLDPSDVSLNPFSGVLAAYILALFSPRYFQKLEDMGKAILPVSGLGG